MSPIRTLRASLIAVWLGTALVSAIEAHGQSARLLQDGGIDDPGWQAALVWGGVAADAAIGLALWRWPCRRTHAAALAAMALMTVVATILQPALWLHPLGPLLKNLPIAAALWLLMDAEHQEEGAA